MRAAAITRPVPGETHNGDAYFVVADSGAAADDAVLASTPDAPEPEPAAHALDLAGRGKLFVAVVDGIGHGPPAAAAAATILQFLRDNHRQELRDVVRGCHEASAHSRGAALGVAELDLSLSHLDFLGVGNVRMQVITPRAAPFPVDTADSAASPGSCQTLVANNGIVGHTLPATLLVAPCSYAPGDVVIMCSDGIDPLMNARVIPGFRSQTAEQTAARILNAFSRPLDDATAIVVR